MTPRRRFSAIVNPVSGRQSMLPQVQHIQKLIEHRGGRMDIAVTQAAGHAAQLAAQVALDTEALLVVGGDGTLGEVINGLDRRPLPMLIYRTGTENLFARELNMPDHPRRVIELLETGTPFAADVGEVNGRRFLSVAGFGFDAECVVRMSRGRRGHITHFDYFWPIWRAFWAHRFPRLEIEVDGEPFFDGQGLALVGNIARYSVGMRILRDARTDDGLLDLGIFPCSTRRRLVLHAARVFLRRHIGEHGLIYRRFRTLTIRSAQRVPIELDGEFAGFLPARCNVSAKALTFLR